jgi:hypothetical protein
MESPLDLTIPIRRRTGKRTPFTIFIFSPAHAACGLPERLSLIQKVGRPGVASMLYRSRTVELPACKARRKIPASCRSFLRPVLLTNDAKWLSTRVRPGNLRASDREEQNLFE